MKPVYKIYTNHSVLIRRYQVSTPEEVREWLRKNGLSDEECMAIRERVSKYHNLTDPQPPPKNSEGEDCWKLVMKDMEDRRAMGLRRYGVPLKAFNGREALVDAYQELLDLCVYMRQAMEELKTLSPPTTGTYGPLDGVNPPALEPQPPLQTPVDP